MTNDELKINVQRVMQVFVQNESGNKVTQFNMMGLTNMILGVIDGTVVIQQGAQKPAAPVETHRVELPDDNTLLPQDNNNIESPKGDKIGIEDIKKSV